MIYLIQVLISINFCSTNNNALSGITSIIASGDLAGGPITTASCNISSFSINTIPTTYSCIAITGDGMFVALGKASEVTVYMKTLQPQAWRSSHVSDALRRTAATFGVYDFTAINSFYFT